MQPLTSNTLGASSLPRSADGHRGALAKRNRLPWVSAEARRYAVKELARRAGVSQEFFSKWTVEVTPERTTVSFGPERNARLHFAHDVGGALEKIATGTIPVAYAGGPQDPHDGGQLPELILPFCDSETDSRAPLYRTSGMGASTCRLDLLVSFLFTLSRVEETLSESLDVHGRFPASASLAARHDFLERPILDEHVFAFREALSSLIPRWQPQARAFHFKLTHDIDDIGIPFGLRTALGHSLKRRRPAATLRDFLSLQTAVEPAELRQVRKLAAISLSRGLHAAFYWKGSSRGPHDSGYDPAQRKVQRVIDSLREAGFELGVHPGYETFLDRAGLKSEVEYLRQALGVRSPGGRQHYLRWSPATWLDWEACGLSYDSSLGFPDRFGFRAGTAFPYQPWSFEHNRELNLIEVPLVLMDCTPVKYMRLARAEGLERIKALIRRVKRTGGVFTMLWHNTPLLDPDYDRWYEPILDLLVGAQRFDVPASASELW